jgi:hypothetical protein
MNLKNPAGQPAIFRHTCRARRFVTRRRFENQLIAVVKSKWGFMTLNPEADHPAGHRNLDEIPFTKD